MQKEALCAIFSKRLAALMKHEGCTISIFCHETGLKEEKVKSWLDCCETPPIEILINIADQYGFSLDFLLGRTDDVIIVQKVPFTA